MNTGYLVQTFAGAGTKIRKRHWSKIRFRGDKHSRAKETFSEFHANFVFLDQHFASDLNLKVRFHGYQLRKLPRYTRESFNRPSQ